ncbi:MAG: hypothetical protein UT66_C0013G0023, partial [candidate division CPR2 bacterium GW2011_GWC1_39_9]
SEIKSLFSTGSISVDTLTGEKGILAAWFGLGGAVVLRKSSKDKERGRKGIWPEFGFPAFLKA